MSTSVEKMRKTILLRGISSTEKTSAIILAQTSMGMNNFNFLWTTGLGVSLF